MSHWLAEPAARQQFWAADGKELLAAELHGVGPRPVAVAMTHRHVDVFACKVDMMHRCGDPQVNAGMRFGKVAEPMHQPLGGKIGRGADCEDPCTLPLQEPLGADRNAVQGIAHHGKIIAAGFGDDQPLALAVEQLDRKLGFKRLDLVADGALRDAQLFRRARKTLVPRGGLEGFQGIERWQAWSHRTTS
jgi:hypothetical protein